MIGNIPVCLCFGLLVGQNIWSGALGSRCVVFFSVFLMTKELLVFY